MSETLLSRIDSSALTRQAVWSLAYDCLILGVIVLSLSMLGLDYLLMGSVSQTVAHWLGWTSSLEVYRNVWHAYVAPIDQWITLLLIGELALRWVLAMYTKQYHRWFFFPFAHWYEVLGCIPTFRALRLLRVVAIGYKLYQLGINLVPQSLIRSGKFYYELILEEISDRIILHVIGGVEAELKTSAAHTTFITNLLEKNRDLIGQALIEVITSGIAPLLLANEHHLKNSIGNAVQAALKNTSEINTLIKLVPIVGKQIDKQVQGIAHTLGENITSEVLKPFTHPETGNNQLVAMLATSVSQMRFNSPALETLIESIVFESINLIRQQVAVQQWKVKEAIQHPIP